ncbi:hypothetical protein QAD02_013027 [Eretmocerus hayati]|uniref:Uncharacterized protein n=1 Tax=Eretmocerus hayati TaxID=131215 RepID=A0ACC2P1H3_9HYME|nr:hypothetical protein QAD02_013027 [Eretmocerus hayati]
MMERRLSGPSLGKCQTMDDLTPSAVSTGPKAKRANETAVKAPQHKKPRFKGVQKSQKDELIDIKNIKKERLESEATASRQRDPKTRASNCTSTKKNTSFDFLTSPAITASSVSGTVFEDHDALLEIKSPLPRTPQQKKPSIKRIQKIQKGVLIDIPNIELGRPASKASGNRPKNSKTQASKCTSTKESASFDSLTSPSINTSSEFVGGLEASTPKSSGSEKMDDALHVSSPMASNVVENHDASADVESSLLQEESSVVQDLKKIISEKDTIISQQKKKIAALEKVLMDKENMLCDLTKCSVDLQRAVINDFLELHEIVQDLKQSKPNTVSPDGLHIAIGYLNICNFKNDWQYLFSLTEPSEFVREMARSLIGEEILIKSTVSGRGTNRKGKGNVEKWDRVDPVKVEAIRDSLNHFLKSYKFETMPSSVKLQHVHSVTEYLRSLISDLKKNKKGRVSEISENSDKIERVSEVRTKRKGPGQQKNIERADEGVNEGENEEIAREPPKSPSNSVENEDDEVPGADELSGYQNEDDDASSILDSSLGKNDTVLIRRNFLLDCPSDYDSQGTPVTR